MLHALLFVGNLSLNGIRTTDGRMHQCLGGAALGYAAGASVVTSSYVLCSEVGADFPFDELLPLTGADALALVHVTGARSIRFTIDEVAETCGTDNPSDVRVCVPVDTRTEWLHVSCRRGVAFEECVARTHSGALSIDVMYPSLLANRDGILKIASLARFIFCNAREYDLLRQIGLPVAALDMLITQGARGVRYQGREASVDVPPYSEALVPVSPTGAGDVFAGAVVACLAQGKKLEEAMCWGTVAAATSTEEVGVLHLFSKRDLIRARFARLWGSG